MTELLLIQREMQVSKILIRDPFPVLLQGKDSIRVIIQSDFFGCYDTSNYIPIHIIGPVAKFGDEDQLCYHAPVIFSDSSQPVNGVPIVSWKWNFGDGNSITATYRGYGTASICIPGNL